MEQLTDFRKRNEKNWNIVNTSTIVDWISSSNLNILLLDNYLFELRAILQINTLWSLLISSITSTISVTQFTVSDASDPILSLGIKILISVTSVMTSLITGYIKVQKIQETIESLEEHKHKWMKFMNSLTTELQVGCQFRSDANVIINSKKDEFNTINGKKIDIPDRIRQKVSQFLLQKQRAQKLLDQAQSCWPIWLSISSCCVWTEQDYNVERLNIKLSFYHSINKNLKKELLDLMFCYPDQVTEVEFNQDSDLFIYTIKNATLEKQLNHSRNLSTFKLSNTFMKQKSVAAFPSLPKSPVQSSATATAAAVTMEEQV